ncbi:PaaX family transcriptional regulator C-terminal domain-containing protein [Hoeflea sp.]|uniref:PaaX family transcriptional regulator C-terminal domain-containing protein n=1 Tax=Hoeflea sp. TaxID=1940281 RepID=UPI0019921FC2|nr:PaaX family transcriptional regulator C-terminal domain-containing protein [Hoeflea sp.]MBC7283656.1 hypothetical protein [Hoeflea sp.]
MAAPLFPLPAKPAIASSMPDADPISAAIQSRLTALQAGGRLSAWSLIVSFLGDAIGPRGGVVSAGAVQAMMARLGIGHGAVRTAISRLAADGWIERSREGRNSFYQLSGDVGETVLIAERRIYAVSSLLPSGAPRSLIIADAAFSDASMHALQEIGALLLSPQLALCFLGVSDLPAQLRPPGVTLDRQPSLVPGAAMLRQMADARQSAEIAELSAAYRPLHTALDSGAAPTPEEAMALRCLMIHEWRRLALKLLAIPADLLPPGDPEPAARALIAAIYARLLPASEAWLDAHAATPSGPLPPPDARLGARFGG